MYTVTQVGFQSREIVMTAHDPSLCREQTGYLRRYQPFKGYHLATCYP
jgi:hypothetical protein